MDIETIRQKKQEIIDRFGPWTNHNIRLQDELYTIGNHLVGSEVKVRRFLQAIADLTGQSFSELRVLDLACLEGLYGIELALQGAQVVGIEGREENLEKARFTKSVLGLDKIDFVRDDVRNLSPEKYGQFDVVLCLGIFYHLDAPDVFEFARNIERVCTRLAIFDTHVSRTREQSYLYQNREYWGRNYTEDETLWASIGNSTSVWLTRPSLYNLLIDVGFSSVYECHMPMIPKYEQMRFREEADRSTFIALKNKPIRLLSTPLLTEEPRCPEKEVPT
ncbi:MAG TPA: methyltransferase domain-containing protein [Oscillatoriales cyanobacterium M59_W2019_021]|nr:MAG: methyltransferase domain-containing protein [Cyanobacteria bacterium J055]HIK33393.1 methyltransferase domain-containing protein [Oscillatoriales cyanobacterium M4454_W2019_049]HIK52360.1 methyltransferase domain-containing protein [Oscillatoriales cyanobacterium M59_W2019_021]